MAQRVWGFSVDVLTGTPIPSATVTVTGNGGATIYSDAGMTTSIPGGIITSDATTGYWYFYGPNGTYQAQISKATYTTYTLGDLQIINGVATGTAVTNGQLLIGHTANKTFAVNTLTGTTNQITVTNGAGTITLAAPQNLHSAATPTFGSLTLSTSGVTQSASTASSFVYLNGSKVLTSTAAPSDGQLLIGDTGGVPLLGSISGTSNQITVTPGAGSITLSTPQNTHSAATPTFAGLTLSGLTAKGAVYASTGGLLQSTAALTNGQLLIGKTNFDPVAASLSAGAGISITPGAGTISIASTAITSLNALTGTSQTLGIDYSGVTGNPAWSSVGTTHTLQLPQASASTGAGLVNATTQTFAGAKTFNSPVTVFPGSQTSTSGPVSVGVSVNTTPVSANGNLMSYTLQPGVLTATGDIVKVTAAGTATTGAAAKTIAVTFGGTGFISKASTAATVAGWVVVAWFCRLSATTVMASAQLNSPNSGWQDGFNTASVACNNLDTLTNVIQFAITGESATQNFLLVETVAA